jgi:two-component system copper resistance phosphate regulon response regulator CusR
MAKVLIVEDDRVIAEGMARHLATAGFDPVVVGKGEQGLARLRFERPDVVVLDLMLPERDGWSVIEAARSEGIATPIVVVSARGTEHDRVHALELGADDYLVKPFHFAELLARVHALLRRTPERAPELYRVADLLCDPRTRRVERGKRRIDLTPREFALLHCLLEHAGEVVTRAVIADRVWDMNFESDTNVIDVQVRRLRLKVDAPGEAPLIHTVRGVGYVLEPRAPT